MVTNAKAARTSGSNEKLIKQDGFKNGFSIGNNSLFWGKEQSKCRKCGVRISKDDEIFSRNRCARCSQKPNEQRVIKHIHKRRFVLGFCGCGLAHSNSLKCQGNGLKVNHVMRLAEFTGFIRGARA